MNIKKVLYKDKEYTIYNPGEILFHNGNKRIIIDQLLDGETPMTRKKIGGIKDYLKVKYDINSEWEYYFIVVHEANIDNIPKCRYCDKCLKFISIAKGYYKTCGDHSCSMKYREFTKWKPNGAYEKNHSSRSEIARKIAISQIENKSHNFQNPDGSWKSKEVQNNLVKNKTHHFLKENGYSEIAKERNKEWNRLGINPFQSNYVTLIANRNNFINLGSPEDECYLYISEWVGINNMIKIGVTSNLEKRKSFRSNTNVYSNIEKVLSGTRIEIADIEYKVKLKFYGRSTIGTETFPIEMKSEILEYVNSLYNK